MRVLVLGAYGLIGSAVRDFFVDRGRTPDSHVHLLSLDATDLLEGRGDSRGIAPKNEERVAGSVMRFEVSSK